ncbi:MAG TPA: GNAT family N-acetyltransferase [Catalimonadaceae bacterium]|nr:GNAT family N-acetyltransferase [Catalimonadaceae bacterium]
MKSSYQTPNLILNSLHPGDEHVILDLINRPGWIDVHGDRNIKTFEDAREFVREIVDSTVLHYWLVKLKESTTPIGMITFTKREFLDHPDIGFEFLSEFTRDEYAFEALKAVLDDVIQNPVHSEVLAIAKNENAGSTTILKKLGLNFENEISNGTDQILVFANTVDKLQLNQLTTTFYSLFKNTRQHLPYFGKIYEICLPETIIVKKGNGNEEVFNIETFIEPRKKILTDGTLTEFEEFEISENTMVIGHIAQRVSRYEKKGYLNGSYFEGQGNKLFQYIRTSKGWNIVSICWEDEPISG